MDNVTHSLVGYAIGEGVYRLRKRENRPPLFQGALWLCSFISNNAPDLDYFYYHFLKGDRLDILLNHRGFTHTALAAFPQVLIALLPIFILARVSKTKFDRSEWGCLVFVALIGTWVHVGLDSLNSYGVHPFWPWSNRWIYNDLVFIVEPWLWISLIPALMRTGPWRWVKYFFGIILLISLGLEWGSGYIPWKMALIVTVWAFALLAVTFRRNCQYPFVHAWASFFTVVAIFLIVGRSIRTTIETEFKSLPSVALLDVVLMPMPSNPFCWSVIAVDESSLGLHYDIRRGLVTPFNRFIPASQCPELRFKWGEVDDSRKIHWIEEKERSVTELLKWRDEHCGVRSFLQFSRVPLFQEEKTYVWVDDARFMWRANAPSFAHFDFPKIGVSCPKFPVPWGEPRADLFQAKGRVK